MISLVTFNGNISENSGSEQYEALNQRVTELENSVDSNILKMTEAISVVNVKFRYFADGSGTNVNYPVVLTLNKDQLIYKSIKFSIDGYKHPSSSTSYPTELETKEYEIMKNGETVIQLYCSTQYSSTVFCYIGRAYDKQAFVALAPVIARYSSNKITLDFSEAGKDFYKSIFQTSNLWLSGTVKYY